MKKGKPKFKIGDRVTIIGRNNPKAFVITAIQKDFGTFYYGLQKNPSLLAREDILEPDRLFRYF